MKLSELQMHLNETESLKLFLENGSEIPEHFHITEAGLTTKHFIDCGGTVRTEKVISFQVWVANDTGHRLSPSKLSKIIGFAASITGSEDLEVEMEYETNTIGRFGLRKEGDAFYLTAKHTNCLAKDECGIPDSKINLNLSQLPIEQSACCIPGGGCC